MALPDVPSSHSVLMTRALVSPPFTLPGHMEMTESGWQDAWRGSVTHPRDLEEPGLALDVWLTGGF